jgi:hypothetical protein
VDEERDLRPRLLDAGSYVLGTRSLSPGVAQLLDIRAVCGRQRSPPLSELARGNGEYA